MRVWDVTTFERTMVLAATVDWLDATSDGAMKREELVEIEVSIGRDMLTSWVRRIREACGEER